MLQKHGTVLATAALLLVGNAASAAPDEIYTARTVITLPGTDKVTSFDISFVDPVIGLYFLSDRTNKAVEEIIPRAIPSLLSSPRPPHSPVSPGTTTPRVRMG